MKKFKLTFLALCCALCFSCDKTEDEPDLIDNDYSITLTSTNGAYCAEGVIMEVEVEDDATTLDFSVEGIKFADSTQSPSMNFYFNDNTYTLESDTYSVSLPYPDPAYEIPQYNMSGESLSASNFSSYSFSDVVLEVTSTNVRGSFTMTSSSGTYSYTFTGTKK